MSKIISLAKWLYSLSRGIVLILGYLFLMIIVISAMSGGTLAWLVNGKIVSLDALTKGYNGLLFGTIILIFTVAILVIIGTNVWRFVKGIKSMLKRKTDEVTEHPFYKS